MPRTKKEAAEEKETKAPKKKATAPRKKKEEIKTEAKATVSKKTEAASEVLLPKIQCIAPGKKTICAHLLTSGHAHQCAAKRLPNGKLSTVRSGKKRRCEFYQETAYNG